MNMMTKAPPDTAADSAAVLREFEAFLYREASLMDSHAYDAWLDLWTEDALYWLPCNEEDVDPARELSIVYERREEIAARVRRLRGKFAHAQSPKSRLLRVLSNIVVESALDDTITGVSNFVLGDVRLNHQNVWFGRNHHTLVRTPDGLRMRRKKVFILNNDTPMSNLTFLV